MTYAGGTDNIEGKRRKEMKILIIEKKVMNLNKTIKNKNKIRVD